MCPFTKTIVDSPIVPAYTACVAVSSWSSEGARYGIHLMEWGLNPVTK